MADKKVPEGKGAPRPTGGPRVSAEAEEAARSRARAADRGGRANGAEGGADRLECTACGARWGTDGPAFCGCGGILFARYDLAGLAGGRRGVLPVDASARGVWRYAPLLPLRDPADRVTLGEGGTPLLPLATTGKRLGLSSLFAKWEGANPTGTFKDRGMTLAVSMAKERGVERLVVPTAGNAGASAAAYAARAGIPLTVVAPEGTPEANLLEARSYGAVVETVPGTIADAGRRAGQLEEEGAFNLATFREPYRLEGKKTMTFEVWEALGAMPDAIVYPTGGGTGLLGVRKAYDELVGLDLTNEALPRLHAVQSSGCAPIVDAFERGAAEPSAPERPTTVASGLNVPTPRAGRLILDAIRASAGAAVRVPDDAIVATARAFAASEGLLLAPEAAATVAALPSLLADGHLHAKQRIVCFLTGTGLKYPKVFTK